MRAWNNEPVAVEGRARLDTGEPAAGARVLLFDLTDPAARPQAATTDGSGQFTLPLGPLAGVLPRFELGANYPNPFNPSTHIPYRLPAAMHVQLEVFNLLGQRVATLVDGEQPAGFHTARWSATDAGGRPVGAGVYLYRLLGDGRQLTRSMLLIDGAGSPVPGSSGAAQPPAIAVEEIAEPVGKYGLTVSGPGLVTYVDPAFQVEARMAPLDVVVEASGNASRKNVSEGLLGDVDNTGVVDFSDALLVAQYSWDPSIVLPSHVDLWLGDVNLDGQVDRRDAALLVVWLYDPSDPSLPEGIGEPAWPPAALAPDPATLSFAADGVWRRFTVEAVEPVHVVVNPEGTLPCLKITSDGSSRSYCLPEAEEGLPASAGQDIYLAACAAGSTTVELRRSDGRILRTHTFTVTGGPLPLIGDDLEGNNRFPAWSPMGRHIAFSSVSNGNADLYVLELEADGTNLRRLTHHPGSDWDPAWSPDGGQIAFSSDREGNDNWNLYVMEADGTDVRVRRLTHHPGWDWDPAWSPDGYRIAFSSDREDHGYRNIYVMEADGTGLHSLTAHLEKAHYRYPAWSPDGGQIAFSADYSEIWVMDADGTNLRLLTDAGWFNVGPAWSPGGDLIAFSSNRDGDHYDIWVMDADGTNLRRLTHHPGHDSSPTWSPWGDFIAFASNRDGDDYDIWVMEFPEWTQPCCGEEVMRAPSVGRDEPINRFPVKTE